MDDALRSAIAATAKAGWELPITTRERRQLPFIGAWEIVEADGTDIAIVGHKLDADLIAAALNHVLNLDVSVSE